MLTENDIIQRLAKYLKGKGYTIKQTRTTKQRGIDIIAHNETHVLFIEAKGETSSKQATKRFGKPFHSGQITNHVARAILAAMKVLQEQPVEEKTKIAIALPDTLDHRKLIEKIITPIQKLGIRVYWVSKNSVSEQY